MMNIGINARIVVIAELVTGMNISAVPSRTASLNFLPFCRCLYMFSTIITESSTMIPDIRTKANIVIVLIE